MRQGKRGLFSFGVARLNKIHVSKTQRELCETGRTPVNCTINNVKCALLFQIKVKEKVVKAHNKVANVFQYVVLTFQSNLALQAP